jgi:hypothetical protein
VQNNALRHQLNSDWLLHQSRHWIREPIALICYSIVQTNFVHQLHLISRTFPRNRLVVIELYFGMDQFPK